MYTDSPIDAPPQPQVAGVPAPRPRNAMTVDVEDYFQVSAFERYIDRGSWEALPCRVERNTHRVLELFARHGARATFFVLGWVAERFPALVREMTAAGHEVASHGYDHTRVTQQTPQAFREDVVRTRAILEDAIGMRVAGYRAASYSIDERNLWAIDVLSEVGYRYSSSIYPIRHDLYGMPSAPRFPFRHSPSGLLEIPVTTVEIMGMRLPAGGGGYFRAFPYWWSQWAVHRVNRVDGIPAIFYFHPWEVDPDQPQQKRLDLRTRFRHYNGLRRMERRLDRLLSEFRWGRVDEVFLDSEVAMVDLGAHAPAQGAPG